MIYFVTGTKQQKSLINRIDKILSAKFRNYDTVELEKEIDVLVYKLYELNYIEVTVIDKDFWLTEKEYKKFWLSYNSFECLRETLYVTL